MLTLITKYFALHARITTLDIANFFRQLSTFINAGIPLLTSLSFQAKNQHKPRLQALILALQQQIQMGQPFSKALASHPTYFDAAMCHLINLGEHTGKFDSILQTITLYLEKNLALKQRIKQALFYPCLIVLLAIIITFSLLYFVVPHFAFLFQDFFDTLPPLTLFIFTLSHCLHEYLWLILFTLPSIFLLFIIFETASKRLQQMIYTALPSLPILKRYYALIACARFSRHLALTYNAGIAILPALPLAAQAANTQTLKIAITVVTNKVRSGMPLSQAMASTNVFPPLFIQFVNIGEESGKLDLMLDKYADIAETNIDTLLQNLHQLLEPLIMLALGVLIGGLVIGMYLPLFKLGSIL
jgi:type IV pilus assembly protein PilC